MTSTFTVPDRLRRSDRVVPDIAPLGSTPYTLGWDIESPKEVSEFQLEHASDKIKLVRALRADWDMPLLEAMGLVNGWIAFGVTRLIFVGFNAY